MVLGGGGAVTGRETLCIDELEPPAPSVVIATTRSSRRGCGTCKDAGVIGVETGGSGVAVCSGIVTSGDVIASKLDGGAITVVVTVLSCKGIVVESMVTDGDVVVEKSVPLIILSTQPHVVATMKIEILCLIEKETRKEKE
jgi:hypothetical protein